MKRMIIILTIFLICTPKADSCVGRLLNIGVVNTVEGQVFAEMLSTIINERTGTTVHVKLFKNQQELYEAVKTKQVDILVENTARALQVLNKAADPNAKRAYETVKAMYEKEKGLVWLKPYGFLKANGDNSRSYTATLIRVEVFSDFPALPRVVDKLAGAINDETYTRLLKAVESGEKPKKVAKDFLKSKKLL